MILVFLWIQGSWKWTQARLLAEKYNFSILEMWQELRNITNSWSELGNNIKWILERWEQVNPTIVWEVMKEAISKQTNKKLILDWFVRNKWNKDSLDSIIDDYRVVFFELDEEEAKKRLLGRMYDPLTGDTFPFGTEVNPKNGNKLEKRADDNNEAILKRISDFFDKTLPLVDWYKQEWKLIKINANQEIDGVYEDLINNLWL